MCLDLYVYVCYSTGMYQLYHNVCWGTKREIAAWHCKFLLMDVSSANKGEPLIAQQSPESSIPSPSLAKVTRRRQLDLVF